MQSIPDALARWDEGGPMRLVTLIDELLEHAKVDVKKLAQISGVDKRLLEKLRTGRDWRLEPPHIEGLLRFARERGFKRGLFDLRPNSIWNTFNKQTPTTVYRSEHPIDGHVESDLRNYWE